MGERPQVGLDRNGKQLLFLRTPSCRRHVLSPHTPLGDLTHSFNYHLSAVTHESSHQPGPFPVPDCKDLCDHFPAVPTSNSAPACSGSSLSTNPPTPTSAPTKGAVPPGPQGPTGLLLPLPGGLREPEPLPSNGLTSPPLLSTQGRWCLCLTSFLFLQPLPGLPDSSLVPSDVSWQVVLQLKLSSPTPGALPPEHDHKHRPGLCPRVLNFRAQVFK